MPTSITSSGITFDDATTLTTGVLPTANIANGAVTTAKINDAAITPAKLSGAQSGSAPIYGARAWVNFDGTTNPPTVRASGNVSSITDNGTGSYTVNLTTAMADANYATVAFAGNSAGNASVTQLAGTTTSSSVGVSIVNSAFVGVDRDVCVTILR